MGEEHFEAICCFCGQTLDHADAVEISFSAPEDREAIQGACAHAHCLVERLHSDVPVLPEIQDRAERERAKG